MASELMSRYRSLGTYSTSFVVGVIGAPFPLRVTMKYIFPIRRALSNPLVVESTSSIETLRSDQVPFPRRQMYV